MYQFCQFLPGACRLDLIHFFTASSRRMSACIVKTAQIIGQDTRIISIIQRKYTDKNCRLCSSSWPEAHRPLKRSSVLTTFCVLAPRYQMPDHHDQTILARMPIILPMAILISAGVIPRFLLPKESFRFFIWHPLPFFFNYHSSNKNPDQVSEIFDAAKEGDSLP